MPSLLTSRLADTLNCPRPLCAAMQHFGVEPDLLTTAKGLCAGYGVLAAVLVGGRVCGAIASGSGSHTQGHTHTANPLSCATAAAVLQHITDNNIVEQAATR